TTSLYRVRSSRSPEGLQFAQLILKLPAGALTALFGVVLLQSGILPPLSAVADARLAAYAVIFGFAQEAFTHFVDRRARNLLSNTRPLDKQNTWLAACWPPVRCAVCACDNFLYVLNGPPSARRAVRPWPGSGYGRGIHQRRRSDRRGSRRRRLGP